MPFSFRARSKGRRRWTLAIAYAALVASCDSPFAPEVQEVERVDINPPVLTMVVGGNATLQARVYGTGDALMPEAKVFWSTQDPTVVTVDQEGVVNGVGAGTAQIAASAGGQSRTIAVTVSQRPIALIRITPPAGTVVAGQTFLLHGEALDGNGNLLPNRLLDWQSNAPTVATVDAAGVVTGVAVGQATISASGEGKTGTSIITVSPPPVSSITIAPNGGTVPAGNTLQFTATPKDANGNALTGRTLEWRSSNDGVATVSASGLMTAISPGQVTITVSAPNGGPGGSSPSASVTVTVLIAPVASARIVPSPASVQVGQTVPLTVNLFDASGDPLSATGRTVNWSTSNAAIATVSSSGAAVGVTVGTVTITATITTPGQAGSVQATASVTVSNQPVVSVNVSPTPAIVHVGYSKQLSAVALDGQGQPLSGRAILWTSSNQNIASVDASSGLVFGVQQGTVQIRATSEGVQGVANLTIDLVRVSGVAVTPSSSTLLPGQTVQLSATPRDSAGNTIAGPALGGRGTLWSSANTAAATVNATGLVTGVAQGSSTVTATIGGTGGTSAITVSALPSATQLAITTQPSGSVQNDIAFAQQPVVQLRDAQGANVLQAGVVITAAITAPGTGALGGTLTATTNASGAASFSGLKITGTTGSRTLTFSAGALATVTSSTVNVQPGVATQLVITTQPPGSANSGQALSSATVVQLRDISNNNVTQAGVQVTASPSPSAGVTIGGGSANTSGSGTATFGAITLTGPAGNYTLTFSSGSLTTATSTSISLSAGSASKLSITTPPPSSVPNGQAFGAVIQLRDGSNNPVALAGVTVSASILTGGPALGGTTVASTDANGVATFTNLTITGTVGARTLLFGASGYTAIGSGAVNVTAGPASALSIATQPSSSAQSGAAFGSQPSVQLTDASGNVVAQAGVTVNVAVNGAGASLIGGTSATTNASGVAAFSGLGLSGTVGTYSLTFSSSVGNATSSSINLTAGAAAKLTITTQPGGASSGASFVQQPAIQVRDAQDNLVSQAGLTITASIASGSGATLSGTSATTNSSGLAVFSGMGLTGTAGNFTITFSSGSLASVTSGTVTLSFGAAAGLVIQSQPGGASSGAAFTTQPVLLVVDAQSNAVQQAGITISASVVGSGATLIGSGSAQTNGGGFAAFSGLGLSGVVGNYAIDFSSGGLPSITSSTVALSAGAAAQLSMSSQPPSSVANGGALSASVQIRDAIGNPLTSSGLSVTVSLVGSGAALGGTTTVASSSGVASFSGLTITGSVGSYSLAFSAAGVTGTSSSSISLTPGAATHLVMATQPSSNALSGVALPTQPSVQLRDASNNAVSQSGVTVDVAVSGGATLGGSASAVTNGAGVASFSGLSISGAAGNYTLSFSSTGLTGTASSSIALTVPASALSITSQPSSSVASGSLFTAQPSVQLVDAGNNPVSQAGVQVTVSVGSGASLIGGTSATTNASGLATFAGLGLSGTVGSYTLTFSASGLTSATSGSIALSAGPAAKLQITAQPGGAASGAAFASQPALQVLDAQNNPVAAGGLTVTASIASGGAATLLGTVQAITDGTGLAAFSDLGLSGPTGAYTIGFSSGSLTGATSGTVTLSAGAAATIVMVTQPGDAASGAPLSPQPSVRLVDAQGNPTSDNGVQVTAAIGSGTGTLGGTVTMSTTGGVATFSDLAITGTGAFTLSFSAPGLNSATSGGVIISFLDVVTGGRASTRGDIGNLSGTTTVAANILRLATVPEPSLDQHGLQMKFLAGSRVSVHLNPFVDNP